MNSNFVKFVIFVPVSHAEAVRKVMGEVGAGRVGNYSHASFSIKGVGRFKPLKGAKPAIGSIGKLEEVEEERIEVVIQKDKLEQLINAIRKVHPYEEMAFDIYPVINDEFV